MNIITAIKQIGPNAIGLVQTGIRRGRSVFQHNSAVFFAPLPTDPLGNNTVTFTGVNSGCEIRVIDKDGVEVAGIESCSADQVLIWPVYSVGSLYNVVIIKIVDVRYKIKEFPYTSQLGSTSIPIQQDLDPWYLNP